MKKTIIGIVGFFALMVTSAAFMQHSTAPAIGYLTPSLAAVNADSNLPTSLSSYTGNYLLLTFWESTHADSRLALKQYQKWIAESAGQSDTLSFMAVNLDKNPRLFEEIIARDRLDRTKQFQIGAEQIEFVKENFQISAQPKSFLIDPEGRITAINPTKDQLNQIMKAQES